MGVDTRGFILEVAAPDSHGTSPAPTAAETSASEPTKGATATTVLLMCRKCGWQGPPQDAVCCRRRFGDGTEEWHLRADCPSCGAYIKNLSRHEHVDLASPNLMESRILVRQAALNPRAVEYEEWAGRQVPRLRTWLEQQAHQ